MCDRVYKEKYMNLKGSILDIGIGGDKFNPNAVGIDRHKENLFDENDFVMDAEFLAFPDSSFDYVFSSHCLEDNEDTYSFLYEWMRVLKDGGTMILVLPHIEYYANVGSGNENPSHKWDFANEDIIEILKDVCEYELIESNVANDSIKISFEVVVKKIKNKEKLDKCKYFEDFKKIQACNIDNQIYNRQKEFFDNFRIIVSIMCQNEKDDLDKLLEQIHNHLIIEKIFIIDGGSFDGTYEILKKYPKTILKVHPYLSGYHEMQAMQRNIQLTYIPFGRWVLLLDPDEECSNDLLDSLENLKNLGKDIDFVQIPRRRNTERYDKNTISDFQPRLIKNSKTIKFWRSPHHETVGFKKSILSKEFGHIIHIDEDSNVRDRVSSTFGLQTKAQNELELNWDGKSIFGQSISRD